MSLLDIETRQTYLKELGYYKGEIDGIQGKLTKQAYLDLQKKYFKRKKDIDGIYGNDTDTLLRDVYYCKDLKYFKVTEFKCGCNTKYCTGYPSVLNCEMLNYLDNLRCTYKRPITITSGMRCTIHNKKVMGSTGSRHPKGKAVDIYMKSVSSTITGRKEIVDYWIKNYPNSRYAYCNGYGKTKDGVSYPKSSTMGNAVHLDVK